jgi:hypothetical protein
VAQTVSPEQWTAELEGRHIQAADARHWIAAYMELIRYLEPIADDSPLAQRHLEQMRSRLAFWRLKAVSPVQGPVP